MIVSGSNNGTIKAWDAATRKCVGVEIRGSAYLVSCLAFSPDGTSIVSASWDKTVRVWDTATGKCIRTLSGHTKIVSSVAFSPNGKKIVSCSWDETVLVWDAATGACIGTLVCPLALTQERGVNSVAFLSNGRFLVSGGDDHMVKVWDLASINCRRAAEEITHSDGGTVLSRSSTVMQQTGTGPVAIGKDELAAAALRAVPAAAAPVVSTSVLLGEDS